MPKTTPRPCYVEGCSNPRARLPGGDLASMCPEHRQQAADRRKAERAAKRISAAAALPPPSPIEPQLPPIRRTGYGETHFSFMRPNGESDASITIMIHDEVSGTFYTGVVKLSVARVYDPNAPQAAHLIERQIQCARAAGALVVARTRLNADLIAARALPDASDVADQRLSAAGS